MPFGAQVKDEQGQPVYTVGPMDVEFQAGEVAFITGGGLKTIEAMVGHVGETREIRPSLREFEALLGGQKQLVHA